jgi:hypothetical protein
MIVAITSNHLAMKNDPEGLVGPLSQALYEATGDRWWIDDGRAYRIDPWCDEPADREGIFLFPHVHFLDRDAGPEDHDYVQPFVFDFPFSPGGAG